MNSYKLLIARYSSFTEKSRRFNDTFLQQTDDLSNHFLIYLLNSFCKVAWVKIEKWFSSFIYQLELWFWKFTFGMKQIGHKMTDTKTSYFLNWKEWDLLQEIFIPIKLLVQKLSTYNGWWLKEHATSCPSSIFTLFTASIIIQLFDNKHHIIFLTFWQIGLFSMISSYI